MDSNKVMQSRLAVLAASTMISSGLICVSASAQDEDTITEFDEIVVTGSHIRRSGYESRAPIQVIDRNAFQQQGASTIVDIARNLTVNTGSFITQETGSLIGTSQFNIRGLGPGSTLVLINGRRAGKSATADGSGNQFFDVNQLPLMVIERIDVQTDGASATYGSEAVGGVVNIVTRKDFDGLEMMGRYENSSNSAYSLNAAFGQEAERGSFALYGTYYNQTRNSRSDFDWLTERVSDARFLSSNGMPGNFQQAILDLGTGAFAGTSGGENPDPDCIAGGGVTITGSNRCRANFRDQVSIIPEENRVQLFAEGNYNITDAIRAYGEMHFSNNEISRTQGTSLFDRGEAGGRMLVPADHPFNFWVSDGADGITYIDPSQWDNSIHTAVPLRVRGRPFGVEEFFDTDFDQDLEFRLNYFRALGGVAFDLGDNWQADVSYVYNKSEWRQSTPFQYVAANLNAALADGSYNPFGTRIVSPSLVSPKDGNSIAGITENVLNNVTYTQVDEAEATQAVLDVVFSGDAFEFNGMPVGVALGGQHREETYFFRQDALTQAGLGGRNNESVADIDGDQDVYAAFAEVLFPVSDNFEISAAIRREDFGGGTGATTDPKISARWQATGTIAIRATYGTAFQAPSVRQTGESVSTAFINDPFTSDANGNLVCGVSTAQNNTVIRTGGDANLNPQSAKNFNAGLVITPASGFSLSLDYWRFDYSGLIRPDANPQAIVDADCADDGIANDPRVTRSVSGQLSGISVSFINTGNVVTDGLDARLGYKFEETEAGNFSLDGTVSYVNKFDISSDDGNVIDGAGSRNFSNPFASVPKWRANGTVAWQYGKHSATATVRYISSYLNDQLDDGSRVNAWTSLDMRYGLALDGLTGVPAVLSVGVNNVFDQDPPSLGQDVRPGYDANVHDVRGRLLYSELSFRF